MRAAIFNAEERHLRPSRVEGSLEVGRSRSPDAYRFRRTISPGTRRPVVLSQRQDAIGTRSAERDGARSLPARFDGRQGRL